MGAKLLRKRIAALGPRGRGARIPAELREEIGRYARDRLGEGVGVREIAAEVGVSRESVRRWTSAAGRRCRGETARALPVEVVGDGVVTSDVVLVTPGGYRVEGLDVQRAAALVRALG